MPMARGFVAFGGRSVGRSQIFGKFKMANNMTEVDLPFYGTIHFLAAYS